ncbi:MAG: LamG domain-containing protein [Lentisphaerae bacterium]|nr:LamG domain-containing protein [Lentisphaerota bacterium]
MLKQFAAIHIPVRENQPFSEVYALRRSNTNKLVFSISLGNGNKVSTIIADAPANFADGKWHELKILLTAEGKLTMAMDGKTFRTGIIPATPLPATQRLAIGDRVGSSYGTFTGLIDDVKLTAL